MKSTRDPYTLRVAAGAVRVVLSVFALVVFRPMIELVRFVEVALYVYTAIASIFLVLIVLRIGDRVRAIVGGCFDMMMITLLVHALGSTTSTFTTIYVFAATLNTLVVGPRVGVTMSVIAAFAYGGLLLAEHLHLVSLVPAVGVVAGDPRTASTALASWLLTALLLIATTTIVASLVTLKDLRERELREANDRLVALTNRDPLTDLWNRRHLFARIERAFEKNKHGLFALSVFDLDGFKSVNDRFGHLAGDDLLVRIARAIRTSVHEDDVVCRFGGDEFVVLLRGCDADSAKARMEAIRLAIRQVASEFREGCDVSASVGLTVSRRDDDPTSLIRRADDLAYRAKRAGGDRVLSDKDPLLVAV